MLKFGCLVTWRETKTKQTKKKHQKKTTHTQKQNKEVFKTTLNQCSNT